MADIGLLVLDRTAWERAAEDPAAFAVEQTLTLGVEPDRRDCRSRGRAGMALGTLPCRTSFTAVGL